MAGTKPKIRFSKVIEILLWLAGLGVLAENIFLFRQNRQLSEALNGGAQLYMNRGMGIAGLPIRLGARPEITLLELVRGVWAVESLDLAPLTLLTRSSNVESGLC